MTQDAHEPEWRARPEGRPLTHQQWANVLFLHWPFPAEPLEARLPGGLDLDLYRGQAWIGLVPLTMWKVRASFLPPFPGLSTFHEINVRTYVRVGGTPGVWFLSLDSSSLLAVHGARLAYHLPYFAAEIEVHREDSTVRFRSTRTHRRAPPARFEATWTLREPVPGARPGSLEHFLTERYCLYTERWGRIFRARIDHPPWSLRGASVRALETTLVESHGLPTPSEEPVVHAADSLAVQVWPLEARPVFSGQTLIGRARRPEPATRVEA
jgi:hypothetical protein